MMDYQTRDLRIRRDLARTVGDALYALALREAEADDITISRDDMSELVEAMEETEETLRRFEAGKEDPKEYGYHERPIAENVHEAVDDSELLTLIEVADILERVQHGEYIEQDELNEAYDTLERVEREVRPPRNRRGCF